MVARDGNFYFRKKTSLGTDSAAKSLVFIRAYSYIRVFEEKYSYFTRIFVIYSYYSDLRHSYLGYANENQGWSSFLKQPMGAHAETEAQAIGRQNEIVSQWSKSYGQTTCWTYLHVRRSWPQCARPKHEAEPCKTATDVLWNCTVSVF